MTNHKSLVIGWLYPELMNTYGDRGNAITLKKRAQWRGIDVELKEFKIGFSEVDLKKCDLLMMGGAQDVQQEIVYKDLRKKKKTLFNMINKGIPGLYVCGGFQFLGNYYKEADGKIIDGLGIFDLYTENPGEGRPRLIGNTAIKPNFELNHKSDIIVGFENHGGRTYLGKDIKPLGTVIKGNGNNEKDEGEGAIYKNSFGTYFHGPILPKNPHLADYLISLAMKRKYKEFELIDLDDQLEWKANHFMLETING